MRRDKNGQKRQKTAKNDQNTANNGQNTANALTAAQCPLATALAAATAATAATAELVATAAASTSAPSVVHLHTTCSGRRTHLPERCTLYTTVTS